MAGAALFLGFAILHTGSMIIIRRRIKGNRMGTVSALIALVSSIVGILYYIFTLLGLTYSVSQYGIFYAIRLNELGVIIPFVYNLLLSVTMIMVGAFFLIYREHFASRGVLIITGFLYVLLGAFALGYIPVPPPSGIFLAITSPLSYNLIYQVFVVNSPLFIAAGVMGATCFSTR
jgi:hypothetical protein